MRTFAHKGYKINSHKKVCLSANFALLSDFFWYWCYYPHWSRDSLSPVCRILFKITMWQIFIHFCKPIFERNSFKNTNIFKIDFDKKYMCDVICMPLRMCIFYG